MSFLRKIALYIYLCVYVCANLYIRDANKYFNISSWFLVSRIFFFFGNKSFSLIWKKQCLLPAFWKIKWNCVVKNTIVSLHIGNLPAFLRLFVDLVNIIDRWPSNKPYAF